MEDTLLGERALEIPQPLFGPPPVPVRLRSLVEVTIEVGSFVALSNGVVCRILSYESNQGASESDEDNDADSACSCRHQTTTFLGAVLQPFDAECPPVVMGCNAKGCAELILTNKIINLNPSDIDNVVFVFGKDDMEKKNITFAGQANAFMCRSFLADGILQPLAPTHLSFPPMPTNLIQNNQEFYTQRIWSSIEHVRNFFAVAMNSTRERKSFSGRLHIPHEFWLYFLLQVKIAESCIDDEDYCVEDQMFQSVARVVRVCSSLSRKTIGLDCSGHMYRFQSQHDLRVFWSIFGYHVTFGVRQRPPRREDRPAKIVDYEEVAFIVGCDEADVVRGCKKTTNPGIDFLYRVELGELCIRVRYKRKVYIRSERSQLPLPLYRLIRHGKCEGMDADGNKPLCVLGFVFKSDNAAASYRVATVDYNKGIAWAESIDQNLSISRSEPENMELPIDSIRQLIAAD